MEHSWYMLRCGVMGEMFHVEQFEWGGVLECSTWNILRKIIGFCGWAFFGEMRRDWYLFGWGDVKCSTWNIFIAEDFEGL